MTKFPTITVLSLRLYAHNHSPTLALNNNVKDLSILTNRIGTRRYFTLYKVGWTTAGSWADKPKVAEDNVSSEINLNHCNSRENGSETKKQSEQQRKAGLIYLLSSFPVNRDHFT